MHSTTCALPLPLPLQEVTLPESDPAAFMAAAADFCNDKVWGQLAAAVFIHPDTQVRESGPRGNVQHGVQHGVHVW